MMLIVNTMSFNIGQSVRNLRDGTKWIPGTVVEHKMQGKVESSNGQKLNWWGVAAGPKGTGGEIRNLL